MRLNVLTVKATELRAHFQDGSLTCEKVVTACLAQITAHNTAGLKLRAIISLAPREDVLPRARSLGADRAADNIKSLLHGIPVVIKVGHTQWVLLIA